VNILGIRYEVPTSDRQKLRERLLLGMGQACVDWSNDTGGCHFCDPDENGDHDETCRLREYFQQFPALDKSRDEVAEDHTLSGNCWKLARECRACGKDNLCDVCHIHHEPRGSCSGCHPCAACEEEEPES
jgi:hypothetical protein